MQTQRRKIRLFPKPTDNPKIINPVSVELFLDFSNWATQSKSQLEIIIEQITPEKRSTISRLEDYPEYKYLIPLGMETALNEVLDIIFNRHMMLRRSLSIENGTYLDKIFATSLQPFSHPQSNAKTKLNKKLNLFFGKEQIAVFHHIKNACSSISYAISNYQTLGIDTGVKLLLGGIHELYLGDQRFFKDQIKTRSAVAKEGGIARNKYYLAVKQEACSLLNTVTPQEGWTQEFDAFKAILPKIKTYIMENNIKRPTLSNIERTLRRWVKNDPLVSAAVRINHQPPTTNHQPLKASVDINALSVFQLIVHSPLEDFLCRRFSYHQACKHLHIDLLSSDKPLLF